MDKTLFDECEKCMQDEPAACTSCCPLHIDVASLSSEIEKGNFQKAYKLLEKKMPFAGIIGMICDHPCETVCVREKTDKAVSVSELERAAVRYGHAPFRQAAYVPKTIGKAAVVGGGLSGITLAVADPEAVRTRWETLAGGPLPACEFTADAASPGITAITVSVDGERRTIEPRLL